MSNILASKALLAHPSISLPAFRKQDKQASADTTSRNGAEAQTARVYKDLFPKQAIANLTGICGEARTYHYKMTLPWMDSGPRLLSAAAYGEYQERMRQFREQAEAANRDLCDSYENWIRLAERKLGGLFNRADYVEPEEFANKFSFTTRFMPVPDVADMRIDISEAQAEVLRCQIDAATQETMNNAMADAWGRIAGRVTKMAASLKAYQPELGLKGNPFRDSLVENVRELVGLLPLLNVTGDSGLDRMAARMKQELCAYDAPELRLDDNLRRQTAEAAESILSDVSSFLA